ncbi:MAG: energy-coupling factor ABC transporter permease [Coprobacillus sp.]
MNYTLMHMADGLISVNIGIIFMIISFIMIGVAIRRINQEHDDKKIPMMGVMGAFVFVAQMINFTIPGTGSSGHIGGGILLCLILGQYPAFLSICSVLIIQCLFFGDGGLLALGCNIFNMGVLPCFIAYPLIVKPLLKKTINPTRVTLASLLGVVVGLQLGAFSVVLQTLMSGITELPFLSFVALMQPIHLAIGLVEGIITTTVVLYVLKDKREIIENTIHNQSFSSLNLKKVFTVFAILSVLIGGVLSLYASSSPDGLEWSIEGITGSADIESNDSTKDIFAKVQSVTSVLPDYNFSGSEGKLGTSVSGIVGGAATLICVGGCGYLIIKKRKNEQAH